ncbi:Selenocysteine lyase/Cysteine desulfurase [Clostridium acidisoli DSM 12555]|uniref:Selenocysteine lyase/Cysteine desulfurase n=1 Tax=Clostridium acidisoli DSM 12555 TaxID=1121291 RepID=A0A1W1XG37_9CLOT|nr:aminotransferase class V-fold PLP-dependent enzyme [Clostridium acidisoli]SMC22900.1 Selenocysteine lyase/Cysteine desulfurase [Clostridium acidisoli DSM 12555]
MCKNYYKSKYRNLIVGVDTKVPVNNGKIVTAINFDNAATTPPFISVLKEIFDYAPWYSSIHRGSGYKSLVSSKLYEESRKIILDFVGADDKLNTVIYVKNATEAINKLANRLFDKKTRYVVLSSYMEHHSNDLPWRKDYKVDYIEVDECGRIDLNSLERQLKKYRGKVKLVALTGASNVTGYINPILAAAKIVHKYGASILIDGAQLVPHTNVNMKNENIDFLVFSAHKMYAPFGIGVLIGPTKTFERGAPDYVGGGTVNLVTHNYVEWNSPPNKEEAGTPNIMGVVALVAAIKTLNLLRRSEIQQYENSLTIYTIDSLKKIRDVKLYCIDSDVLRVGIVPFNIEGVEHGIVSEILSNEAGISVRDGCFCAQPYIRKLLKLDSNNIDRTRNRPGMVRISFGLYNDYSEVDRLVWILSKIVNNKEYYRNKYYKNYLER